MITFLYVLLITGVFMGLTRWAYTQGRESGDAQAQQRIVRKLDDHSDAFLEWYLDAHDLERVKWRKGEVDAYMRGLRNAKRIARERSPER